MADNIQLIENGGTITRTEHPIECTQYSPQVTPLPIVRGYEEVDAGVPDAVSDSPAGANTPSFSNSSARSPFWCIDTRISHPPMNSFYRGRQWVSYRFAIWAY